MNFFLRSTLFALLSITSFSSNALPTPAEELANIESAYNGATAASIPSGYVLVKLRIEGATTTIYEGPILTSGHNVSTPSGGNHKCDGTNLGANPTPGATITTALDDAASISGFTWDGDWYPTFEDFFITRVSGDTQTATAFWGILLDFQFTLVGGCQQQVSNGDDVLIAYDAFGKTFFAKLEVIGSKVVRVGKKVKVRVTDGKSGAVLAGATVGGQTTDANGEAEISWASKGVKKIKAEHPNAVRSNGVHVIVV